MANMQDHATERLGSLSSLTAERARSRRSMSSRYPAGRRGPCGGEPAKCGMGGWNP
jgi:hypothetical protein